MKESLLSKKELREQLKKIRQELSPHRRTEAAEHLFTLLPDLISYTSVLSFASLSLEIDTSLLNRFLATTGRLLLPKTVRGNLKIYRVTDASTQLEKGPINLFEPIPAKCEEVRSGQIEIVLVPGLGFDQANHRIGYGKGCYDRLLASLSCPSIGIGYKEQLVDTLPTDPHDRPLTQIKLF